MINMLNQKMVYGGPLHSDSEVVDFQPLKVVFEKTRPDQKGNIKQVKDLNDTEALVTWFVSGQPYVVSGINLLVKIAYRLEDIECNTVCIAKDSPYPSQSSGRMQSVHFIGGPRIGIYDINTLRSLCKDDMSEFQVKLELMMVMCKKGNAVLLIEEAAIQNLDIQIGAVIKVAAVS